MIVYKKFAKAYTPQMAQVLYGWQTDITFIIKGKPVIDNNGDVTFPYQRTINFQGVIQPYKPTHLEIRSYEQKRYKQYLIHTFTKIALDAGDRIGYGIHTYKIIDLSDFYLNGYYEYQLVQDFESS